MSERVVTPPPSGGVTAAADQAEQRKRAAARAADKTGGIRPRPWPICRGFSGRQLLLVPTGPSSWRSLAEASGCRASRTPCSKNSEAYVLSFAQVWRDLSALFRDAGRSDELTLLALAIPAS